MLHSQAVRDDPFMPSPGQVCARCPVPQCQCNGMDELYCIYYPRSCYECGFYKCVADPMNVKGEGLQQQQQQQQQPPQQQQQAPIQVHGQEQPQQQPQQVSIPVVIVQQPGVTKEVLAPQLPPPVPVIPGRDQRRDPRAGRRRNPRHAPNSGRSRAQQQQQGRRREGREPPRGTRMLFRVQDASFSSDEEFEL